MFLAEIITKQAAAAEKSEFSSLIVKSRRLVKEHFSKLTPEKLSKHDALIIKYCPPDMEALMTRLGSIGPHTTIKEITLENSTGDKFSDTSRKNILSALSQFANLERLTIYFPIEITKDLKYLS